MSSQAVCLAALCSPCMCQACPAPLHFTLFAVCCCLGQVLYMSGLAVSSLVICLLIAAPSSLCTCQVRTCARCKVEQHLHSGLQQFFHMARLPPCSCVSILSSVCTSHS